MSLKNILCEVQLLQFSSGNPTLGERGRTFPAYEILIKPQTPQARTRANAACQLCCTCVLNGILAKIEAL
jgi:hypothetical protein